MKHLDDERLADAVEGRVTPDAARHLEACGQCRDEVAALRTMLARVATDVAPEPSPLFWDHFESRLANTLQAAPAPAPSRRSFAIEWLTAATVAATLMLVVFASQMAPRHGGARDADTPAPLVRLAPVDDVEADEAWALVRSLADDLDYDAAREAGVVPAPGSAEVAALELSPDEQASLLALIEQELRRTDS